VQQFFLMMAKLSLQVKNTIFCLFSAGEDKIIRLWKNSANIKFSKICGHSAPVRSLCFSKNDELILTASNDKSVRIYQTTNK
jgi:WD40 repeat protein